MTDRSLTLRLLGKGWSFPIQPAGRDQAIPLASGTEKVRQSLLMILETEPGERIMRPTFGCGLRRYLMKPNTNATRALIQHDVRRALETWEPRIQLQSVQVQAGDDPSLVLIAVHYRHRHDASPDSLVFPFYLES